MSVKHGLLALLCERPRYGYELKAVFEARTGAVWPLNVGQIYTTLVRLERDGLVTREGENAEGHVLYRVTPMGSQKVDEWWCEAVDREMPARDELAIKLALAVAAPDVDPSDVLRRQRSATVQAMQILDRKKTALLADEIAATLILDALLLATEAEVKWLDHCESQL